MSYKKIYLWKALRQFIKTFGEYINVPYVYIIILPEYNYNYIEALNTYIENFIKKNEIRKIILGILNVYELKEEIDEICIYELSKRDCDAFVQLYELFPLCNNIMFISKHIRGRIVPDDLSEKELVKIMLERKGEVKNNEMSENNKF